MLCSEVNLAKNDDSPTDEEINKVIKLVKEYSKLNVPAQQRINMFDYIKEKWNDRI